MQLVGGANVKQGRGLKVELLGKTNEWRGRGLDVKLVGVANREWVWPINDLGRF